MPEVRREARFLLVALIAALVLGVYVILPYLNTITLAVVIGIIFAPVGTWLRPKVKSESLAAFIALLIALLLVITPLAFFGFKAGEEALGLYNRVKKDQTVAELQTVAVPLQGAIQKLPQPIQELVPATIDLGPIVKSIGLWIFDRVGSLFGILTTLTLELFLLIVGIYYVIKDGHRFVEYLIRITPIEMEYENSLFKKLHASVISVVRGSIVIAVIQGVLAGLGFFVLGVPNAALWGAATIVASLIPIVGTALTLVPATAYLLLTGAPIAALILILWGVLIVGFVDNAFRSQLMKKGMDAHLFLILLSVLGGLEFFGPIGFISGPLLLAIVTALLEIYMSYREKTDRLDTSATLAS